jgi:hypothetical protein
MAQGAHDESLKLRLSQKTLDKYLADFAGCAGDKDAFRLGHGCLF